MSEIKSLQRILAVQLLYQSSINNNDGNFDFDEILKQSIETKNFNKLKKKSNLNFTKVLPYQKEVFWYKAKFIRKILNLLVIS